MKTRSINSRHLVAMLCVLALTAANAGAGLRDEITDSFAVKPGGTLTFDSDLASLEIHTSDTDTLRAAFVREFKVSTAQEADRLRQKLDVQMTKTDNDVKITVRWTGGRNDRTCKKSGPVSGSRCRANSTWICARWGARGSPILTGR